MSTQLQRCYYVRFLEVAFLLGVLGCIFSFAFSFRLPLVLSHNFELVIC